MVLSRLKIKHRLRSTRRKMFEKATWVAGNSSQLMQKINILLDIGTTTGGAVYSAKSAAVDTAHAIEDLQCSDYPCAILDGVALCCDIGAFGVSFLSRNITTGRAFAACTATSKFARTLRNKCKGSDWGLFGCKK